MDFLNLNDNKKFNLICLKCKINDNNENYILKIIKILKYKKLIKNVFDNELVLIIFVSNDFKKSNLLEFNNKIDKNITFYKIYLIYLKTHINKLYSYIFKLYIEYDIIKNSKKKFDTLEEFFKNKNNLQKILLENIIQKNEAVSILKNENNMKIIKINNYNNFRYLYLSKLLNLFTIFGNIINLYYNFYDGTIWIEYENNYEAKRIIDERKKLIYDNKIIDITLCNINKNEYLELNLIQRIQLSKNLNRYNNSLNNRFNNISTTIMISNINKNLKIHKFFLLISNNDKLMLFKLKNNFKGTSKICIAEYESIKDSIKWIVKLNNTSFENKKLKVSFSFNKIYKNNFN